MAMLLRGCKPRICKLYRNRCKYVAVIPLVLPDQPKGQSFQVGQPENNYYCLIQLSIFPHFHQFLTKYERTTGELTI